MMIEAIGHILTAVKDGIKELKRIADALEKIASKG